MGGLKAGPGRQWKGEFFIGPGAAYSIEDIGFTGPASMNLEIPKLEAGRYRPSQEFIRRGREPLEERTQWHYAGFEIFE